MNSSEPEHPYLETDEEFEGVGAHRDNPRFDAEAAATEFEAQHAKVSDDATL